MVNNAAFVKAYSQFSISPKSPPRSPSSKPSSISSHAGISHASIFIAGPSHASSPMHRLLKVSMAPLDPHVAEHPCDSQAVHPALHLTLHSLHLINSSSLQSPSTVHSLTNCMVPIFCPQHVPSSAQSPDGLMHCVARTQGVNLSLHLTLHHLSIVNGCLLQCFPRIKQSLVNVIFPIRSPQHVPTLAQGPSDGRTHTPSETHGENLKRGFASA